tara:strand:- start:1567 stop:2748 length:1182 start_codon:yes stop_codon:yes gene_type:complete
MKKIIFLVENFFTLRDFNRFNIQEYLSDNIIVEVWDLTEFLEKDFKKLNKPDDELNAEYVKRFKDIDNIMKNFKELKQNVLLSVHLKYNLKNLKIFKLLSENKIDYFMYNTSSPNLYQLARYKKNNIIMKLNKFIKNLTMDRFFNFFLNLIIQNINPRFFRVYPMTYLLVGGAIFYKKKNKLISKDTKIVWIHQKDYDLFLKNKQNNFKPLNKQYAVFLDQAVPFNNDNIRQKVFIDPKKYYSSLENFFNFLKEKYQIETIVCAHPRASNELTKYINNYSVVKNQTIKYVENSSFVICHDSLAINFAVIYNKPLLFIYNEVLKQDRTYNHIGEINEIANIFDKKPINVDNINNLDLSKEIEINKLKYEKYFKNYIKFKGDNKLISETVKGLLK